MDKKSPSDKICTTPHPPAGFGSQKFFSFIFLQNDSLDSASLGVLKENSN